MNLVRISEDTIVDKDKVQALVSEQYNGRFYTHIYLMGNREFLVEGNVKDIGDLLMEADDDGCVC
jgi:hypothetical protein